MPALTSPQPIRHCTEEDVRQSWADAQESAIFIRGGYDYHRRHLHGRALLDACGDVRDRWVLDLGCGEGWCCRELARRGANVVGVDISEAQIELARGCPDGDGRIDYLVMDGADADKELRNVEFDLVTASMSLHCMVDPGAVLAAARGVLATGGRVVCSMPHPLTHMLGGRQCHREPSSGSLTMTVGKYFDPGAYNVTWDLPRMGASWSTIRWSRSLEDYWRYFAAAGLVVLNLHEPKPTSDVLREYPDLRNTAEVPYYLILVAGRVSDVHRSQCVGKPA